MLLVLQCGAVYPKGTGIQQLEEDLMASSAGRSLGILALQFRVSAVYSNDSVPNIGTGMPITLSAQLLIETQKACSRVTQVSKAIHLQSLANKGLP